jgi:hypothetical protein
LAGLGESATFRVSLNKQIERESFGGTGKFHASKPF